MICQIVRWGNLLMDIPLLIFNLGFKKLWKVTYNFVRCVYSMEQEVYEGDFWNEFYNIVKYFD